MANQTLAQKVHEDLIAERNAAVAERDHPRIVKLLNTLILLTGSEEENRAIEMPLPTCKHEHIRPDGACADCGTQVFRPLQQ